jgi:hypothetical protein
VLCREEAQNLQNAKPKLDAMGVKLVGIVKEWDEAEIKVTPLPLPGLFGNRSMTYDWAYASVSRSVTCDWASSGSRPEVVADKTFLC